MSTSNYIVLVFFWFIVFFAFIVPAVYFVYAFIRTKLNERDSRYEDLIKYVDDDYKLFKEKYQSSCISEKKLLRKFFGIKANLKKAEVLLRQEEERNAEDRRKDKILRRMYSYSYEDMLYEIFAPVTNFYRNSKFYSVGELPIDDVVCRISKKMSIPLEEAENIFKLFKEKELLKTSVIKKDGILMWVCTLGPLLRFHWSVISKNDMNIKRWIENHPQPTEIEN